MGIRLYLLNKNKIKTLEKQLAFLSYENNKLKDTLRTIHDRLMGVSDEIRTQVDVGEVTFAVPENSMIVDLKLKTGENYE